MGDPDTFSVLDEKIGHPSISFMYSYMALQDIMPLTGHLFLARFWAIFTVGMSHKFVFANVTPVCWERIGFCVVCSE